MDYRVTAVLVAAGSSTRMGFDKLSFDLGGETVLERSVRAFDECPEVDELGQRSVLLPLPYSALRALSFVVHTDAKRIFAFELKGREEIEAFSSAAEKYLLHHLERGFDTLENYKRLQALRRRK